ncbi:hypothetical protein Tco_0472900 [Tanacetum coccineum]
MNREYLGPIAQLWGWQPFGADTLTGRLLVSIPIRPHPHYCPGSCLGRPPLVVDIDKFLGVFNLFPKGTDPYVGGTD